MASTISAAAGDMIYEVVDHLVENGNLTSLHDALL